jgi:hypothetical protein
MQLIHVLPRHCGNLVLSKLRADVAFDLASNLSARTKPVALLNVLCEVAIKQAIHYVCVDVSPPLGNRIGTTAHCVENPLCMGTRLMCRHLAVFSDCQAPRATLLIAILH